MSPRDHLNASPPAASRANGESAQLGGPAGGDLLLRALTWSLLASGLIWFLSIAVIGGTVHPACRDLRAETFRHQVERQRMDLAKTKVLARRVDQGLRWLELKELGHETNRRRRGVGAVTGVAAQLEGSAGADSFDEVLP